MWLWDAASRERNVGHEHTAFRVLTPISLSKYIDVEMW